MLMNIVAFTFLIVLSLILTTTIGHETLAFKSTSASHSDGITRGINDVFCDINLCQGHGYYPSCPSGHTKLYCSGYTQGYNKEWGRQTGNGNSNSKVRSQNNTGTQPTAPPTYQTNNLSTNVSALVDEGNALLSQGRYSQVVEYL